MCATVVPGSCIDCLKIGRECLKATGQFKNCKKKFKMDRKIDMCPEQCPTVTKCIDCIQRPKMCVKSSAAVCKDLGFKRGECNAPMPSKCAMPSNCVDCLKKPASKDKKCQREFKKRCEIKCQKPGEGDVFSV